MKELPGDRARLAFWSVGAVLAGIVGYVVYRFVGTFVLGLFIYYATRPVYKRVRKRIRQPSLAAAISLLLLAMPALGLVGYALAIGINQLRAFVSNGQLGPIATYLQPYYDVSAVFQDPGQLLAGDGMARLGEFLADASSLLGFFGIMAVHLFLMFAIAFYLLRDDHRLARWFRVRFTDERGIVDRFLREVDRDLHQVYFGNILHAVISAGLGAIIYSLLNVVAPAGMGIPYAALLGLLAGIASLVPIVGMKLVYVPMSAYLFAVPVVDGLTGVWWFPITFVVVSFVVVDTIPDLVLRPYISGRSLHVGMVMVAYVLGPLLFGWYGIFLAPLLLVVVIHFGRIVLPELLAGRPIKPYAVDPTYVIDPPADDDG